MIADKKVWCDWCAVELVQKGNGRLTGVGQDKPAVPLLIGDRICGDCDAKIGRGPAVYKIKPNRSLGKYARDVESGRIDAPFTGRVSVQTALGKADMPSPVKLQTDGRLRPGDREVLKHVEYH